MIERATSLELTVEEEVALRKAYMASEAHLNQAASSLADLVQQSHCRCARFVRQVGT